MGFYVQRRKGHGAPLEVDPATGEERLAPEGGRGCIGDMPWGQGTQGVAEEGALRFLTWELRITIRGKGVLGERQASTAARPPPLLI